MTDVDHTHYRDNEIHHAGLRAFRGGGLKLLINGCYFRKLDGGAGRKKVKTFVRTLVA